MLLLLLGALLLYDAAFLASGRQLGSARRIQRTSLLGLPGLRISDQAQRRQLASHGDDHSQYAQPARQQASKVAGNRDSGSEKPEGDRETSATKQERHEVQ